MTPKYPYASEWDHTETELAEAIDKLSDTQRRRTVASLEPADELTPEQLEAFAKLAKTFPGSTIRKDYQTIISVPKTHDELVDAAKSVWCSAEFARRTEAEKDNAQ